MFSNLTELQELRFTDTCIEFLDKTMFSNLINLKILTLCGNRIESIEENSFSNLHNLESLDLSVNLLEKNQNLNPNINKDEILNRSLQSNIKVYFS